MGILRFKIRKTKIVFVGKFRFSKKEKNDHLSQFTLWNKWSLGIWFRKNKVVGAKEFRNPKNWGYNLVNDYMLGIDLLVFHGWVSWNTGGMVLKLNYKDKEKRKKETYTFDIIEEVIKRIDDKTSDEDVLLEIYNEVKNIYGEEKTNKFLKEEDNYLNNLLKEVKNEFKCR